MKKLSQFEFSNAFMQSVWNACEIGDNFGNHEIVSEHRKRELPHKCIEIGVNSKLFFLLALY